jgi:hypothetical protein
VAKATHPFMKKRGSKRFFFEKKKQKTFTPRQFACGAVLATRAVPGQKVFLLLFVHKKKTLPS